MSESEIKALETFLDKRFARVFDRFEQIEKQLKEMEYGLISKLKKWTMTFEGMRELASTFNWIDWRIQRNGFGS